MIKDYDKVLLDRNEWGKSTDSRIRWRIMDNGSPPERFIWERLSEETFDFYRRSKGVYNEIVDAIRLSVISMIYSEKLYGFNGINGDNYDVLETADGEEIEATIENYYPVQWSIDNPDEPKIVFEYEIDEKIV